MIPIRLEPRGTVHSFHSALNLNGLLLGFVFVNTLTAIACEEKLDCAPAETWRRVAEVPAEY